MPVGRGYLPIGSANAPGQACGERCVICPRGFGQGGA